MATRQWNITYLLIILVLGTYTYAAPMDGKFGEMMDKMRQNMADMIHKANMRHRAVFPDVPAVPQPFFLNEVPESAARFSVCDDALMDGLCFDEGFRCPITGVRPEGYLLCANTVWVLMFCASGTIFDDHAQDCVLPTTLASISASILDVTDDAAIPDFDDVSESTDEPRIVTDSFLTEAAQELDDLPSEVAEILEEIPSEDLGTVQEEASFSSPSEDGMRAFSDIFENDYEGDCKLGTYRPNVDDTMYYDECVMIGPVQTIWLRRRCPTGTMAKQFITPDMPCDYKEMAMEPPEGAEVQIETALSEEERNITFRQESPGSRTNGKESSKRITKVETSMWTHNTSSNATAPHDDVDDLDEELASSRIEDAQLEGITAAPMTEETSPSDEPIILDDDSRAFTEGREGFSTEQTTAPTIPKNILTTEKAVDPKEEFKMPLHTSESPRGLTSPPVTHELITGVTESSLGLTDVTSNIKSSTGYEIHLTDGDKIEVHGVTQALMTATEASPTPRLSNATDSVSTKSTAVPTLSTTSETTSASVATTAEPRVTDETNNSENLSSTESTIQPRFTKPAMISSTSSDDEFINTTESKPENFTTPQTPGQRSEFHILDDVAEVFESVSPSDDTTDNQLDVIDSDFSGVIDSGAENTEEDILDEATEDLMMQAHGELLGGNNVDFDSLSLVSRSELDESEKEEGEEKAEVPFVFAMDLIAVGDKTEEDHDPEELIKLLNEEVYETIQ